MTRPTAIRSVGLAVGISILLVVGVLGLEVSRSRDALAGVSCSGWRSDVKTLSDTDRRNVHFQARTAQIQTLRRMRRPASLSAHTPRLAGAEMRVHQVRAQVLEARVRADGAIALVVASRGDASKTMLAEFPRPRCVDSSFKREEIRRARADVVAACGPISSSGVTELSGNVVIRGVGFWGQTRGRGGAAPNGIELYPALSFSGSCDPGSPSPTDDTIPPIDSLRPIRDPIDSASESSASDPLDRYYEVGMVNFDLPSGQEVLQQDRFAVRDGWEFFDRWHYTCVTTFLQHDGERVARMVYRTADGQNLGYAGLNDRYGNEQPAGGSLCALPTDNEPMTETETKPLGLSDSVVSFAADGQVFATYVCPATSPRNADTWCEFEEDEVGPNHVVLEVYWERDLIVVIDIDRMSPAVTITHS